ncbi:MAG: lipase maturation factor family protein [bacterium]|nr:lipase maturation factor family protein [bacterium]
MSRGVPRDCRLVRWLFLRCLGGVFLVALLSLWVQIIPLVGESGILPAADFFDRARDALGSDAVRRVPTLLWLADSDAALHGLCAAGTLLSLLLVAGVAQLPCLVLLWAIYLSLCQAGQVFLGFQWDALLLETALLSCFFAPAGIRPRAPASESPVPRSGLWLLRLLVFKLMLLSGAVKLVSMDETWWRLTALDHHYFTQPIPVWTAWYAHHLPGWMQKFSVCVMFAIEIGVPFLIFCGRRARAVACLLLILLQVLIAASGNFGFFNLLTAVLCLALLDDRALTRFFNREPALAPPGASAARRTLRRLRAIGAIALVLVSALTFVEEMVRSAPRQGFDGWVGGVFRGGAWVVDRARPRVLTWTDPFRSINGYGLFRAMTTSRPEIVVEGSLDGREWAEYDFRWKPGAVERRPARVSPHMPRLDWQMWFAALNPQRASHWLQGLIRELFEASPDVLSLLDADPFGGARPEYLRLVVYDYRFSTPAERRESGAWWWRQNRRELTGTLSRSRFVVDRPAPPRRVRDVPTVAELEYSAVVASRHSARPR